MGDFIWGLFAALFGLIAVIGGLVCRFGSVIYGAITAYTLYSSQQETMVWAIAYGLWGVVWVGVVSWIISVVSLYLAGIFGAIAVAK